MEQGDELEAKPDNGTEATGSIAAQDVKDVEPIAQAKPPQDAEAGAQKGRAYCGLTGNCGGWHRISQGT